MNNVQKIENKEQTALDAIARYLNGEDATAIAQTYQITRQRLYQVMSETFPDQWAQAQSSRALAEFDRTYEEMRSAPDALSLARAREMHKSAQWVMERLLRKLYGETKPEQTGMQITINVRRDEPAQVVIEQEGGSSSEGGVGS